MNLIQLSSICAAMLFATAAAAAPTPASVERADGARASQGVELAREAEKGDDRRGRGRGGDDGPGHRLSEPLPETTVAREAESGDDHRGRGRGGDDRKRG